MLKCRGQEAAKRQRAEIAGDPALTIRKTLVNPFPPNKTKYYPPRSFPPSHSNPPPTRGVEVIFIQVEDGNAPPTLSHAVHAIVLVTWLESAKADSDQQPCPSHLLLQT